MLFEQIKPSISTCALSFYDSKEINIANYVSDWHIHTECEILLQHSGEKNIFVNDDKLTLSAGDIIFINGKIPHKTITPSGSSGALLQFRLSCATTNSNDVEFEKILEMSNLPFVLFRFGTPTNTEIARCIEKIYIENSNKEKYYEYYIKSYLYELIAILYRNNVLTDRNEIMLKIENLLPVLEYVNKNYAEQITLKEISSIANMHPSYFCRVFKNALGVSFIEYQNLVKIYNAKKLMRYRQKSITEISFDVGFSSVSYFIKTFKKHNHFSPNRYKSLFIKAE